MDYFDLQIDVFGYLVFFKCLNLKFFENFQYYMFFSLLMF